MKGWFTILGVVILFPALMPPAQAVNINYPDFADVSKLFLIKQAQGVYDDVNYSPGRHVLRLTRTTGDTIGVAWLKTPVTLPSDFSFKTTFRFRLHEVTAGADGFTFVIQTAGVDSTMWGGGGGNLGYGYDGSPGQTKIAPSVAVEFDTWSNWWFPTNRPPYDPQVGGDNHMDINWNGEFQDIPEIIGFPAIDLNDGTIWQAWVEYDGSTLRAWVGSPGTRPESPVLNYPLSLSGILGTNQVYLGFTASYSGDWQHHDILSWEFNPGVAAGAVCAINQFLLSE